MLDLKAKLLAAGLVTAEQVKKVEDEEASKKQREKERRADQRAARDQREARRGGAGRHQESRRDGRREDPDEKRAARDHKEEEAQRWRKRLDELKAAPKSEQYDIVRGWVQRHRLDDKTAVPSENATRFHFARSDGTIGHITLEPEVQTRLAAGEAGIITFMGHNGLEHAVVPADLARDVAHVKPEWLRSLAGVTEATDATGSSAGGEPGVGASDDDATSALGQTADRGEETSSEAAEPPTDHAHDEHRPH